MAPTRLLPTRRNPLLQDDHTPPVEVLIERRVLRSTELKAKAGTVGLANATKSRNLGNFDYLHLFAPFPKDLRGSEIFPAGPTPIPKGYYLMRRSSDGFVSTSGMYKAAFPWSSKREEDAERQYLSSSHATDNEEIAGNIWSTPDFALELATEYGIYDWIVALLDPHPIHDADSRIAVPPRFEITRPAAPAVNGTMSTRRTASRDLRSVSPAKQTAPTPNRPKATPRKRRTKKATATPSVADSVASDIDEADELNGVLDEEAKEIVVEAIAEAEEEATELAQEAAALVAAEEADEDDDPLQDGTVRVSVTEDVAPGVDGTEVTSTNVKIELPAGSKDLKLPKDTEGVVELARDIIENAKELEQGASGNKSSAKGKKNLKRKANDLDEDTQARGPEEIIEEVGEGDATELATGEVAIHGRPAKRTRLMVAAEEYRKEKMTRRAVTGVAGALAVGIMIPFLQNLL